jgi:hypothetical protein
MDARKLLDMVQTALVTTPDMYAFAAQIVEAQKEEDAKVAEAMGHVDVAEAIRA